MIEKFRLSRGTLKKSNIREIRYFGFTMVEVLISLILLGIGLSFSAKVFVAGKYFIKESDNKTRAMEIASVHMNEYLTKSYEELSPDGETLPVIDNGFTWIATIKSLSMPPVSPKVNTIPYKQIEVICSYKEQNVNGVIVAKSVRLVNMVVYPYMHIYSAVSSPDNVIVRHYDSAAIAATHGECTVVDLDFQTKVQSDLLVFYNISMNITDSSDIGPIDLILSKCFITPISAIKGVPIGASVGYEIQTGTPIITQPTINNTVSVSGLEKGVYRLKIVWFKDKNHPHGTIKGKKANAVVLQVEK
ncbi:MAG: prepilin-type N-terminal cleavage/methylation domain-containing protein [Candidatus Omnitrophota bacterium]